MAYGRLFEASNVGFMIPKIERKIVGDIKSSTPRELLFWHRRSAELWLSEGEEKKVDRASCSKKGFEHVAPRRGGGVEAR